MPALAGRYDAEFQDAFVDGKPYRGQNIVEVVPVTPGAAYVRFHLDFYNGHVCTLAGVAESDRAELVYRERGEPVGSEPCHLHIRHHGDDLAWDDEGGSCKAYCGARGSFLNGALPWRSRRPITYLARLKASSEYRDALTAWQRHR